MIVVWRVVDSCNLSCPFCAFDKRMAFPRTQVAPEDVLQFAKALAEHQAITGDRVLLSWLGGEPLQWKPLTSLTQAVRAMGLDVSATTNGSTLGSPAVRQHLCSSYKELTISIDGLSHFHDAMRGWPGGFEKLRLWISALSREAQGLGSTLKLRVNVVLMHQNVQEFGLLCRELANWGIAEITYNQLGGRDRPEFYPTHRLRPADVDLLQRELPGISGELLDKGIVLIGGEDYLARIRASTLDECISIDDCRPGDEFLFIDEAGRISPCSFTTEEYGVDFRTITTAADLAVLPATFRDLRKTKRSTQCDNCLSTQVCGKYKNASASGPLKEREAASGRYAAVSSSPM